MRPKYLALSLLALAFVFPAEGQTPPAPQPQPTQGRYQLLPVPIGERGVISQELFLFDSQTGRVWHFRPEKYIDDGSGKLPTFVREVFVPVTIIPNDGQKVLPDGN